MKGLERLGVIRELSRKNPKWKHKDLFRLLQKEDIWVAAYENIKGGINGAGLAKIQKVQTKVIVEKYRIPKANGKKRPFGIPTPTDELVQEVIRMVLEAVYEPNFDKRSFGFRNGIGVHDALQYVEDQFRWVDWVIKGEIKKVSSTIEHKKLCEILSQRIDDVRFMNLIRKSLKCGIYDHSHRWYSKLGPILANIYYNELDQWVSQTQKTSKLANAKQSSLLNQGIEIRYTRYADDWIIGIKGSRKLAEQIRNEVGYFLSKHLKHEKTKIINLRFGKMYFLGYEIFLPRNMKLVKHKKDHGKRTIGRSTPKLRFHLPIEKVTKRLYEGGYITYSNNKIRPISKGSYTPREDAVIVNHFKSVWLGLFNFYSGCTNRSHLQYIHYLLHMSCAMSLAHRHRSSSNKIFKKHGKRLEILDKKGDTNKVIASFPYHTRWKVSDRKWQIAKNFKDPFN